MATTVHAVRARGGLYVAAALSVPLAAGCGGETRTPPPWYDRDRVTLDGSVEEHGFTIQVVAGNARTTDPQVEEVYIEPRGSGPMYLAITWTSPSDAAARLLELRRRVPDLSVTRVGRDGAEPPAIELPAVHPGAELVLVLADAHVGYTTTVPDEDRPGGRAVLAYLPVSAHGGFACEGRAAPPARREDPERSAAAMEAMCASIRSR